MLSSSAKPSFLQVVADTARLIVPARKRQIPNFPYVAQFFKGRKGIEIGGPSRIFTRNIPIYPIIDGLDGANFSNTTVWEGTIQEGGLFQYGNKTGRQYILDATDLGSIADEQYDFLISSHCLEHIANPIKAVKEWLRVIKPNGSILIVVPNKLCCFDYKRPYTSFDHVLNDYKEEKTEEDLTHLEEILNLHDLSMDNGSTDFAFFKERSLKNFENRCLHHHVFSIRLLYEIFEYCNVKPLYNNVTGLNMTIVGIKQ